MYSHNLFYYPYASFTNEQLPLLKVAALYFDKLIVLDPVGASWATVGADHVARDAITLLKDAGILEVVTPADVLAKYAGPLTEAVRRDGRHHGYIGTEQKCLDRNGPGQQVGRINHVPHGITKGADHRWQLQRVNS